MAKGERGFWSSLPGVLTGLAGILTAGFGLVGLAVSQGWVGDGPDGRGTVVRISVAPDTLALNALVGEDVGVVTVTNEGTQPVSVTAVIGGEDETSFEADDGDCTRSQIAPERSCDLEVTFDAPAGRYQATLVVSAGDDGEGAEEVALRGTSGDILG